MNFKEQSFNKNEYFNMMHTEPIVFEKMSKRILSWLPKHPREYVVICIGTDRSTGDSLGPLAGTFFSQKNPKHMTIYGTLHQPIHAKNLKESIIEINKKYNNPFIIAVDACLGKSKNVGHLIAGTGSLAPGAALNKDLPPVGNIYLTGVVNIGGFMEYTVLQSTRLSIVVDMAQSIATILQIIDENLKHNDSAPSVPSVFLSEYSNMLK